MLLLVACSAPVPGVGAPLVLVNEVAADNNSTWDDGTSAFPDWVELYNAGDAAVSLAELSLSEGGRAWRGGEGELLPGEHLLVVADGAYHAPFRLSAGETLVLAHAGVEIDRVSVADAATDVVWARHPDGGEGALTRVATPGAANPDAPSDTLDPSDGAFGPLVHTVDIELPEDAVASLREDRLTYVEGAVVLDGLRYAPVEVRLKSTMGSRREVDEKPGWKLNLDGIADFSWKGMTDLTLNNMVQDPSYLREHLAYTLYRDSGVPAPRVAWAQVRLNGLDYGLSLLVETVDDRFLARWYEDPTGALYEGSVGVDLYPGEEARYAYDEGPEPEDRSDLTALIAALDAPPDASGLTTLEGLVDLDAVLTHFAVEAVALHWDGYQNPNNYRLYHNPASDRFEMLPWGADESFDRIQFDPWSGRGRLLRWCVSNPECAARYGARLVEVADRADTLGLREEATWVAAWLRPRIEKDPRREFDMRRHDEEVHATVELLGRWPAEVRRRVGESP